MAAAPVDVAQNDRAGGASRSSQVPAFQQTPPDRRNPASREQLLRRVRAEFDELQGLTLTLAQAERLFCLREDVCVRILDTLIREGLLVLRPDALYVRREIRT
jgi:hypothetical protein